MVQNTIKIDSGYITVPVQVDDNPAVQISFNPNDKDFAVKLHSFYFDVKEKIREVEARALKQPAVDENGMQLDITTLMQDYDDINVWLRDKIDSLLGAGTSRKVFGDTFYSGDGLYVYLQLIEGIFQAAAPTREAKIRKHVRK